MKDYKIINKKLDVNKFSPQKLDISFSGNILYVTSIPFPNKKIFLLTDTDKFYVIENNNLSKPQVFQLKSDILNSGKLNSKALKFQTDSLESQIWTDKKGNHVLIKYKRVCFYYNPNMQNKIEELNLITFGNTLIQPYAVVFNEDKCNEKDTGVFLVSDYNSSIYEVQLFLSEKNEMMRSRFGEILKLKFDSKKNTPSTEDSLNLNFFELDKDDRIIDFKLITQGETILLLAITKNLLFQFFGKKDFRNLFNDYDVEMGDISKAVKKFFPQKQKCNQVKIVKKLKNGEKFEINRVEMERKEPSVFSRIQLLKKENKNEFDFFGFMTDCGYIIGEINKDLKPQNKFNVFKYYKFDKETKEKYEIIHQIMPKAVCESNFNRFFLYTDYLVVQNKLTNTIKQNEHLKLDLIDIFDNEDSIIVYNKKNIYKIPLDNANENLYEDYIQKGDYKTALLLKKDDALLRPSLHKLYADNLFNKKQFLEAAIEYAFSNEIFEHVCIKFLKINNVAGLIRYIILIMQFRLNHIKNEKNKDKKKEGETNGETNENNKEQFIERFLLHTWILELLAEKLENEKNDELVKEIKEITRYERIGYKYIDANLIYNILNLFNKQDELIVFATLKKDYEIIIRSLIGKKKIDLTLEQFNLLFCGDEGELDTKLKKYFYKYGNILIKENIAKTIDSLIQYFRPENPEELIRLLISPNFKSITENDNNFKIVMKYIKDLMKKSNKKNDKEQKLAKCQNLHNLYILLVSQSKYGTYKESFLRELKSTIDIFTQNQQFEIKEKITDKIFFDLNFAKKIFKEKEDNKSKEILCLIYFLLNQYLDSIDVAIENNFEELLLYLTKNILDEKFRKKIWLKIFVYEKEKHNLTKAKEIIEKSDNIIKIEDVIPLMSDNEKLNDLKEELTKCIKYSEESVIKLNNEIREFNEANNSINKDIDFSEKKAVKKKFTELRCSKCNKNINTGKYSKFYLFPCQHIFDLQCLVDIYMEFASYKLNDKNFQDKIAVIKDMSKKIKQYEDRKNLAMIGKGEFDKEEEFVLNVTKKQLFDYLNDECLLCGQDMIDSTQIDFGNDEKLEWDLYY